MSGPSHELSAVVALARALIGSAQADLVGTWPRSVAFLGRQALEHALDRFWAVHAPGVEVVSTRAQLICLATYAGDEVARRATYTWHALSNGCHHHAYDLPPTERELNGWLDEVEWLVGALA